ncbi:hypothetical protein YC2023_028641 [Brassica napus]
MDTYITNVRDKRLKLDKSEPSFDERRRACGRAKKRGSVTDVKTIKLCSESELKFLYQSDSRPTNIGE